MRKTTGQYNVSNQFVDYDPPGVPNGTVADADYLNDIQNDLVGIQDFADISEQAGTNTPVLKSMIRIAKEYSMPVGTIYPLFPTHVGLNRSVQTG